MKSRNLIPNTKIANYVDRVLIIEYNQLTTDFNLPLYANGVPTLLFTSERGEIEKSVGSHLTLFGQTLIPKTLNLTKGFTLIAYFFKPYSLLSLFNVAAQELTDRPVDLKLLDCHNATELQERLLNADSTDSMIVLLDDFVSTLIAQSRPDCAIIKYATTKIAANPSKEILVSLQKELRITERTFQRNFEVKVGVAPNQYRRINQFNSAFYQLLRKQYRKLSDIAFDNGYTDQSHYIRAFKEFTGITPREFLSWG
jgi:AraC-like DNA-binding protein